MVKLSRGMEYYFLIFEGMVIPLCWHGKITRLHGNPFQAAIMVTEIQWITPGPGNVITLAWYSKQAAWLNYKGHWKKAKVHVKI